MMILFLMLALALLFTAPLLIAFRPAHIRNRREAALELHRGQLTELLRDREEGRIGGPEYQAARLEVERRLLVADGAVQPEMNGNAKLLLIATIVALPIAAFALYLPGSTPFVPSEPHTQWAARQTAENAKFDNIIAILRAHLATDSNPVDLSQGQAYLAEALAERAGAITPEALKLFQESLVSAPANASWRTLDEQRIVQAQAAGE